MILQTKYDKGQDVFYIDRQEKRVKSGVIISVTAYSTCISNYSRYDLQTSEDEGANYIHEDDIFLTKEDAIATLKRILI